jgi:hypothetical protein
MNSGLLCSTNVNGEIFNGSSKKYCGSECVCAARKAPKKRVDDTLHPPNEKTSAVDSQPCR